MLSFLPAWKSRVAKKVKILHNSMTFHYEKDLNSKDVNSKRKFEIKAKKVSAWKRPIFRGQPNSGSVNHKQLLKQPLNFTTSWDNSPPPGSFRLANMPGSLRLKGQMTTVVTCKKRKTAINFICSLWQMQIKKYLS